MAALKPTRVYLEREQKRALQRRAKANGTNLSDELRRAIDCYLNGVTPDELRFLDDGTRKVEENIKEMACELDRINARLNAALATLSRSRQRTSGSVH
jgi:hypothetical protein